MTKFYRPPQGIYSTQNLSMARETGISHIFWSLAYVDWYQDKPAGSAGKLLQKLTKRIHPGAICTAATATSSTNAQILDELLDKMGRDGISFISE